MNRRRLCPMQGLCLLALLLIPAPPIHGQLGHRVAPQTDVRITPRIGEAIPQNLIFQNDTGADVRLGDLLRGKPVVLVPVYYQCPMLCGLELNGLVRCLRAMSLTVGDEFDIITFSFDPQDDSRLAAQKKRNYVESYGRDQAVTGWHFLTGTQSSIDALCQAIGFPTAFDPQTGRYAHAAGIMVLTPDGRLARYFYGVEFTPRELRLALVEASSGRIGTVSDQVQLLCYQYDPASGKYGLAVFRGLQISGAITVLAILSAMGWMLRKERLTAARSIIPRSEPPLTTAGGTE